MTTQLRDYQERALESVYRYLRTKDSNPCVVVPTGGGKTPIIARLCSDAVSLWSGRVYVISHVKELLEQSVRHLNRDAPGLSVGIFSAGLGQKDLSKPVTVAGIQSIYQVDAPAPDLILVDECHRIPLDGEGMYRGFIQSMKAKNPDLRVIGFTATPYRTGEGMVTTPDGILNEICFEVGIRELIAKGFLSPVHAKRGTDTTDFSGLEVQRGEFVASQVESLMLDDTKVLNTVGDILDRAKDRKSVIIFAASVNHGNLLASMLRDASNEEVVEVYGDTDSDDRKDAIEGFRSGKIRYLVNCQVLTLGFDAPNVDCVVLARPTASPGLYYQMIGRGFRVAEGKKDCLVLDFGGNVERHGPVDALKPDKARKEGSGEAPAKTCPTCFSILPTATRVCPDCGFEFEMPKPNLSKSYDGEVLSSTEVVDVQTVSYRPHLGKESGLLSFRVDYGVGIRTVPEFVCLEHSGYALEKALQWWGRRGQSPAPKTVDEALSRASELRTPKKLTVSFGGKYPRILSYTF